MNNKQQKLMTACAVIDPLEGRVLVAPNKVRTYKSTGLSSKPVDPEVQIEDVVPNETEMVLEQVETKVNYRHQTAVVLQKSEDEKRFKIGDTVIFDLGSLKEFDYIKGVSELNKYDVRYVLRKN